MRYLGDFSTVGQWRDASYWLNFCCFWGLSLINRWLPFLFPLTFLLLGTFDWVFVWVIDVFLHSIRKAQCIWISIRDQSGSGTWCSTNFIGRIRSFRDFSWLQFLFPWVFSLKAMSKSTFFGSCFLFSFGWFLEVIIIFLFAFMTLYFRGETLKICWCWEVFGERFIGELLVYFSLACSSRFGRDGTGWTCKEKLFVRERTNLSLSTVYLSYSTLSSTQSSLRVKDSIF